eukprot:TRINITY_DN21985_c0_g1_i1.p1 TRINITY_DN21985_c0_g1~~TRINITY_DN21985_c0_g1_i1.p1  ORF type:complete len:493 (+),score=90.36 TRINITY_DN21985_c0_g1_i1:70-1479(+)
MEEEKKEEVIDDDDDEKMCRYCFGDDEDGPLISPCACKGGQKYVHLECLRRWQRMILISQPTHPAYWEDDERHRLCNVCKSEFTCAPPTRGELASGFTGPEIAALIAKDCCIGAREYFTKSLEEQMEREPMIGIFSSYQHWIRGVYLITTVEDDDGKLVVSMRGVSELRALQEKLSPDNTLEIRGSKKYKLCAEGPLDGVPEESLREVMTTLAAPAKLVFRPTAAISCSDDHVSAVNLARPFKSGQEPSDPKREAIIRETKTSSVDIQYYRGGPVSSDEITTCLVIGGRKTGYTIKQDLKEALLLAKAFQAVSTKPETNNIAVGQTVEIQGLKARPELNGKKGLAQYWDSERGRFDVRLFDSYEGVRVKPVNLIPQTEGKSGTVFVFYGNATWTRAQLLSEIARGHWGLAKTLITDVTIPYNERHFSLEKRLIYAPVTDMTEGYIRKAEEEMQELRQQARQIQNNDDSD